MSRRGSLPAQWPAYTRSRSRSDSPTSAHAPRASGVWRYRGRTRLPVRRRTVERVHLPLHGSLLIWTTFRCSSTSLRRRTSSASHPGRRRFQLSGTVRLGPSSTFRRGFSGYLCRRIRLSSQMIPVVTLSRWVRRDAVRRARERGTTGIYAGSGNCSRRISSRPLAVHSDMLARSAVGKATEVPLLTASGLSAPRG